MSLDLADLWDTPISRKIANDISTISGLYCGPASVVWIAAVWNDREGRSYDYKKRLKDKSLFADGPRPFRFDLPGLQKNLSSLLLRETNGELELSKEIYFKYSSIHDVLQKLRMPVIVRILAPSLSQGLHYVTVYKSETRDRDNTIQFYWQDNGLFGNNLTNAGFSESGWRSARANFFFWGASRVVNNKR